jgi:hypothetical protein
MINYMAYNISWEPESRSTNDKVTITKLQMENSE